MVTTIGMGVMTGVTKVKVKTCTGCKESLPISEFNKDRSRADGLRDRCRKCGSGQAKKYRNSEQGRNARQQYLKKYNISEHGRQVKSKYQKQYRGTPRGKEVERRGQLKYLYGLTPEQYQQMYLSQDGCCGICKEHRSEEERHFDIDCDPNTGEVRGLLCWKCNQMLGRYENGHNFKQELVDQFEEYIAVGVLKEE